MVVADQSSSNPTLSDAQEQKEVAELFELINNYRASRNPPLNRLKKHAILQQVAQRHSDDELAAGVSSGEFTSGLLPGEATTRARLEAAGLPQDAVVKERQDVTQNPVPRDGTSQAAFDALHDNSARRNFGMLGHDWTHVGIGLATPGNYWTVLFAQLNPPNQ